MNKILSVVDVLLTPLVNIVPEPVRKQIYLGIPVVIAILAALDGSGLLSGTAAVIVGAVYSALSGLVGAANTKSAAKVSAPVAPPAAK